MSATKLRENPSDNDICAASKSSESLYSFSSVNSKSMLPRRTASRIGSTRSKSSEVRQRVISARLIRYKNLQNQLADALQHISTLTNENRLLKTLQKRQDSALSKYQGANAELPQLLRSHAEELRISNAKHRALSVKNRELTAQAKQKDEIILKMSEQNKHLTQLNGDKNLETRETLTGKVHYLELRMAEKDEQIKVLSRRINLEAKNFKVQLYAEQKKYKELCQQMEKQVAARTSRAMSDFYQTTFKSNNRLPRSSSKNCRSDDGSSQSNRTYNQESVEVAKTCDHSCSADEGDDQTEIVTSSTWFARIEHSDDDDDLVVQKIVENVDEKPLAIEFDQLSLKENGHGPINGAEAQCNGNDNENEVIENGSARTSVSVQSKSADCHIPKRTMLNPKKKTQLLAALKSIETGQKVGSTNGCK